MLMERVMWGCVDLLMRWCEDVNCHADVEKHLITILRFFNRFLSLVVITAWAPLVS